MSTVKTIGAGIGVLVLCVAAIVTLAAIGLGVRYFMAEPTGKVVMHETVTSGRAQLNSYDHFYDACAMIQGYEASLQGYRKALTVAKSEDDIQRLNTVITAVEAERSRAVMQYNADARKTETMARYKDRGLPDFINVANMDTVCQN